MSDDDPRCGVSGIMRSGDGAQTLCIRQNQIERDAELCHAAWSGRVLDYMILQEVERQFGKRGRD